MATYINAVAVADPVQPTSAKLRRVENLMYALDGTILADSLTSTTFTTWDIEWQNLTAAQYAAIITPISGGAVFTFQPPMLSSPVNAIADPASFQIDYSTPDNGVTVKYGLKVTILETV